MREFKFTLAQDEVNVVLNALAQLPYIQVFALIDKMQQQAKASPNQTEEGAACPQ